MTDLYVPSTEYVKSTYVRSSPGWARMNRSVMFEYWLTTEQTSAFFAGQRWSADRFGLGQVLVDDRHRGMVEILTNLAEQDNSEKMPTTEDMLRSYSILVPAWSREDRVEEFHRWMNAMLAEPWERGRQAMATKLGHPEILTGNFNPYRT